jgi:hypothetical protein
MAFSSIVLPEPVPPQITTFSRARRDPQHPPDPGRHGAVVDHRAQAQPLPRELANGDARAIDRQRRKYDVDPAAVMQPSIDHRASLIDPPPHPRNDLLRNGRDVVRIPELDVGQLDLAEPLHVNAVRRVHQNIADRIIPQQRLDRPIPDHVVGKFLREPHLFAPRQLVALLVGDIVDHLLELPLQRHRRQVRRHRRIDLLQHPPPQLPGELFGLHRPQRPRDSAFRHRLRYRQRLIATPERLHPPNIRRSHDRPE